MTALKPLALSIKIVLLDDRGCCLMLKRSAASKNNPGMWDLPGGKMDPGETFDRALVREVEEETGLQAEVTGAAGAAFSESDTHRIVTLILEGRAKSGEVRLSEEHEAYAWVAPGHASELDVVPHLRTVIEQYARSQTV